MTAPDSRVDVDVEISDDWHSDLFPTVDAASEFYRRGPVGWSPRLGGDGVEALELTSTAWAVDGAVVHAAESSFFAGLPAGSAVLDSALVMRALPLVWETPSVEFAASTAQV